ncbi:hypothetical protein ACFE04_011326 [Oxalis oulophora]
MRSRPENISRPTSVGDECSDDIFEEHSGSFDLKEESSFRNELIKTTQGSRGSAATKSGSSGGGGDGGGQQGGGFGERSRPENISRPTKVGDEFSDDSSEEHSGSFDLKEESSFRNDSIKTTTFNLNKDDQGSRGSASTKSRFSCGRPCPRGGGVSRPKNELANEYIKIKTFNLNEDDQGSRGSAATQSGSSGGGGGGQQGGGTGTAATK